jgi:uncharacterized protein
MKMLLVLIAIAVLLWLLKRSLTRKSGPKAPPKAGRRRVAAPEPIVACVQCGLHLPRDEMISGRGGVFCGAAHRAEFEKAHPE